MKYREGTARRLPSHCPKGRAARVMKTRTRITNSEGFECRCAEQRSHRSAVRQLAMWDWDCMSRKYIRPVGRLCWCGAAGYFVMSELNKAGRRCRPDRLGPRNPKGT